MAAPSAVLDDQADAVAPVPNRETRRAAAKQAKRRPATFADMRGKKPRTDTVVIPTTDEDGEEFEMTVKIRAIGSTAYDKLVAANPPNRVQRERGDTWNIDTFAPALIAACCVEPQLTLEQATEIYSSEDWAAGEIGALFYGCQRICNAGTEVPFTGGV